MTTLQYSRGRSEDGETINNKCCEHRCTSVLDGVFQLMTKCSLCTSRIWDVANVARCADCGCTMHGPYSYTNMLHLLAVNTKKRVAAERGDYENQTDGDPEEPRLLLYVTNSRKTINIHGTPLLTMNKTLEMDVSETTEPVTPFHSLYFRILTEKNEEIERLKTLNSTLTKNNLNLNSKTEVFEQKSTERDITFDTRHTNPTVYEELSILQAKLRHLEAEKYEFRIQSTEREIDRLNMSLTKTNDDMNVLKNQFYSISIENQMTKENFQNKIENVFKKYDHQKIRLREIERNATVSAMSNARSTDRTIDMLFRTGWAGDSCARAEREPTSASGQSAATVPPPPPPPPPPFTQTNVTSKQNTGAPTPPPPPPPPPPPSLSTTAAVPPSSGPKVYHRIPITDELLETVKLKPPRDRPRK